MAKTKKKPKEYTQKEIKKYGLCKHHLVGYKQLKTLVRKQQKYIVNQDKILDRLSKDIENKSNMMNLWMTNRQTWTDKINCVSINFYNLSISFNCFLIEFINFS